MKQRGAGYYPTGTTLRDTIEAQGRMHSWVAEKAGVSKYTFSRIVAGTQGATPEQANAVAEALGVPLFLLFELRYSSKSVLKSIDPIAEVA